MVAIKDPVLDVVSRTLANLEATDRRRDGRAEFFEVTQLTNSLLSLVVVPHELGIIYHLVQLDGQVSSEGITRWRATDIRFRLQAFPGRAPSQLRPFLTGLRNAVAHSSLEYHEVNGDISAITFQNRSNDRARTLLWQVEFDLPNLRMFLLCLAREVEAARGRQLRAEIGSTQVPGVKGLAELFGASS
jgi:hypothetical protein